MGEGDRNFTRFMRTWTLNTDLPVQGGLLTTGFLADTIRDMPDWQDFADDDLIRFHEALQDFAAGFPASHSPNESQTEQDLIAPVLDALGWIDTLPQQNLSPKGRSDVPDRLLFASPGAMARANEQADEWKRYEHGAALLEAKRWNRPLDRRSDDPGETAPPSTQMLRYMRRADDVTEGKLRWGILTNGRHWRLYFSGARSVSEEFLELDLWEALGLDEDGAERLPLDAEQRLHWLKVFILVFRNEAFLGSGADGRSFHLRAMDEGRSYETRIAEDLSGKVFNEVFPNLACAISAAAPEGTELGDVREGALVLLYRLLFLLFAEDRNLLPVTDARYERYSLRRLRREVGSEFDAGRTFSESVSALWSRLDGLFRCVGDGDAALGLPPYNGGLFEIGRPGVLDGLRLPDAAVAPLIDALSFERTTGERKYINYRDLSVQQLGSVYERILEHDVVRETDSVAIRLNPYARKVSGSYYTPDELVHRVLEETVDPLLDRCRNAFLDRITAPGDAVSLEDIAPLDPASRMLDLRICDPAMGSGHFLVALVDRLADHVIAGMSEATRDAGQLVDGYVSPLEERIAGIRSTILANARDNGWAVDESRLDDRHIVRRMILKRCVFGADKNPMAVELAKLSLWLHTFTVGAPLSFLDHHLRCGDSLFGAWVPASSNLFLRGPLEDALGSADRMESIELLTDAEIAEAHRSAELYAEVAMMTAPLDAFLSLTHAFGWMDPGKDRSSAIVAFADGLYGDPVAIAQGDEPILQEPNGNAGTQKAFAAFQGAVAEARSLVREERFINWQVAFPGVWTDWDKPGLTGGFDAVIGNPPWDRMKLQEVEWFAERSPEIASAAKASDRKALIRQLDDDDSLSLAFAKTSTRAEAALRTARKGGAYPLLGSGDINLYALFVERAMTLVREDGIIGLVVPSGIAADKTAAVFFRGVSTTGRLKALFDFENRRTRYALPPFFPDVDSRFKFSIFVAGRQDGQFPAARCAFFVQDMSELDDPERCFDLSAEDFVRVNPNTGTAPVFRTRMDADLTTAVYGRLPVLVDRSGDEPVKSWSVWYLRMFDMTNDSDLFRTRSELQEQEGAWPVGGNVFDSPQGRWLPLYEGKMVQAYDHRAASVVVNPENLFRPGQPLPATDEQHQDPDWVPEPQYWVPEVRCTETEGLDWVLGLKEITAPTNARTVIASIQPAHAFGNKLPLLLPDENERVEHLLLANLNAIPFDFIARQKVQGQTLNLFILEQLPVIPPVRFAEIKFGPKTAALVVRETVLELTYTSHDMAPFARDLGHVDDAGKVKAPFTWDAERRLALRAKLDAVFFHLYGITDRQDARHVYGTFPIVEREESEAYGSYRSRDLCLAWMNAFAAGDPDAEIST